MLHVTDTDRVRILRLDRPQARNAFDIALYDATTDALLAAADDPTVAVVVITGTGDAFSAGNDIGDMARLAAGEIGPGRHGFTGMVETLIDFPKPVICAVNGLGVGIGATILGLCDLAFMARTARLRCPFTRLAVAPEAASSATFPRLLGRQNATWVLLSSEWIDAETAAAMGLVFAVTEPDELMSVTLDHARILASKPISSLVASKRLVVEPYRAEMKAALAREGEAFGHLLGAPANLEAMRAFAEKREPDFSGIDT
ncbi:MAG: enoyl-CoA hydratase/isomerase family protein [Actinomyces sp.]|nr:MAG: enoyl-CoA hydratase/isomerase family protein [Actinomyces sp.]